MKKTIIILNILVLLIIVLFVIEYFPYGIKAYKTKDFTIKIPRMSIKVKETKNELVFNSFRDVNSLKRDRKKILKEYHVLKENDKEYYVDEKQNLIIKKYQIKKGFFINKIIIKYE